MQKIFLDMLHSCAALSEDCSELEMVNKLKIQAMPCRMVTRFQCAVSPEFMANMLSYATGSPVYASPPYQQGPHPMMVSPPHNQPSGMYQQPGYPMGMMYPGHPMGMMVPHPHFEGGNGH